MEQVVTKCDWCLATIDKGQTYRDFGSYGAHFHDDCFNGMSALQLAQKALDWNEYQVRRMP